MATASKAVETTTQGIIGAKRMNVPQFPTVGDVTVPARVKKIVCQNAGSENILMNFDNDGSGDYWTLKPGDAPLVIEISDSTVLHGTVVGGTGTIECIYWG